MDKKACHYFQHSPTGVTTDYANQLMVVIWPQDLRDALKGKRGAVKKARARLTLSLPLLPTYSEYLRRKVSQYNANAIEKREEPIEFAWLFEGHAGSTIKKLDRLAEEIRALWHSEVRKVDLKQLMRLMSEAYYLIYGEAYFREIFSEILEFPDHNARFVR